MHRMANYATKKYAPVMELADMSDLGSDALRRKGSSPFGCTIRKRSYRFFENDGSVSYALLKKMFSIPVFRSKIKC